MSLDAQPPADKKPCRFLFVAALLSVATLAPLLWLNLSPRFHPGFEDLRNPLAEAWSPDPRVERGWPFTAHRQFAKPSKVNARGVWDGLGLALDLSLLLGGLVLIWVTAFVLQFRGRSS